jgi:hypothetical protein
MTQTIPDCILIESAFFGNDYRLEGPLVAKVVTIVRDSTGDQYAVFEMADMAGLFTIHLGSNFFKGWAPR